MNNNNSPTANMIADHEEKDAKRKDIKIIKMFNIKKVLKNFFPINSLLNILSFKETINIQTLYKKNLIFKFYLLKIKKLRENYSEFFILIYFKVLFKKID